MSDTSTNCRIMLSPESTSVSASRLNDPDDDGLLREPSDISDVTTTSCSTMDPDLCSGVHSIDYRLRQSNMSVLSRYKVGKQIDSLLSRYRNIAIIIVIIIIIILLKIKIIIIK